MTQETATPTAAAPRDPAVKRTSPWGVSLFVLLVLAVLVIFPAGVALELGQRPYELLRRGYPGPDVALITTVLLSLSQSAALVSTGSLIHLLFLQDTPARQAGFLKDGFELFLLRISSGIWAASSAVLIFFEALDSNGTPLRGALAPGALSYLVEATDAPKAWMLNLVAALIVLCASFFALRWSGLLIPLWVSLVAALAPVVSGQVLVGPDHDLGSDAAIFQTIASSVFFGPVLVATLRVLSGRLLSLTALKRLFFLGVFCMPVILVTTIVIGAFMLAGSPVTGSLTGWFFLASGACSLGLVALLIFSALLDRRGGLRAQNLILLLSSASLMIAGWLGVSVSMTRQPPPQYFVPTSIQQIFMGFDVPDAPTLAVLFGQWRPNLLFLGIATTAIIVYLIAVVILRRRGDHWPLGRTAAWIAGWGVVITATSSGFGKYSAPDFGVHMIVHMSLNMLAPGLLVLGGVITLILRVTRADRDQPAGLHHWITWILRWPVLHVLYNPLVVFALFIGSYYGLYFTGLFGEYMRFHWAHQLMNVHFLVVGYLYYSLIIGVDRPPRPLPHIGKLGYVLAAMPFHAFFGVILMTSSTIIAENFYQYIGAPWADLPARQYFGGGVAWAGGEIPLLIVIIALGIQWSRQDAREAKRKDRHIDAGRDDEFEAYNQMLQKLTERESSRPAPRPVPSQDKDGQS